MKKRGFTLIELSIVLVIIGLLIGGSFKIFQVMKDRAQTSRDQDDIKVAKEAIIGNAILNNNTLPSATFFKDNLSPIKNNQHPIFYANDNALQSRDICSFLTTNLKVQTPTRTINNVAFVLASEGPNHNMQTAIKDNLDGTYSVKTYDYATKVDDNTTPKNIVENYDDVVDWVTLSQLKSDLRCNDKPFRFLNDSLPSAIKGQSYSATLYVENNVTSVSISCTNNGDKGINFSDPNFSGTPTEAGTSERTCTATENSPGTRSVTKQFVITINANSSGSAGGSGNNGG